MVTLKLIFWGVSFSRLASGIGFFLLRQKKETSSFPPPFARLISLSPRLPPSGSLSSFFFYQDYAVASVFPTHPTPLD